jgi:hypothetical protein
MIFSVLACDHAAGIEGASKAAATQTSPRTFGILIEFSSRSVFGNWFAA